MITWYSIDNELSTVDHEAVTKDGAMAIIDEYFTRLLPHYKFGEDAIAATMFGFQKSESEFVEICINRQNLVSFKYEVSEPRKVLFLTIPKVYQKELTLHSKEELKAKVEAFFDLDSASYKLEVGK